MCVAFSNSENTKQQLALPLVSGKLRVLFWTQLRVDTLMRYRHRAKLETRMQVLSSCPWAQRLSTFSAALVRRPSVSLVSPCCFSRFSPLPRSRGQIRKRDCIRLSRQGAPAGSIGWFFCRWAHSHDDDLIQNLKCTTAFAINYHKISGNVVRLNQLTLADRDCLGERLPRPPLLDNRISELAELEVQVCWRAADSATIANVTLPGAVKVRIKR